MTNSDRSIQITFDKETVDMLMACGKWRGISIEELAKAHVEDWLDIDYPESQDRLTRRGIHRDGPITLEAQTRQQTSPNWRDELGISRLRPRPE